MEKLGNSHQLPQIGPPFVYLGLSYTALNLFHAGLARWFYPLQKCKVLGGWNFNVSLTWGFYIFLQCSFFRPRKPPDTRSTPWETHFSCWRYLRHRGPRFSSSSEFLTARTLHQLTMTKKESRGSFEGKITKEPRPSFICNYMISHLGIKFKVNVYI